VRTIAHLDMDAFFVSVELQRRPELRGQPVVVAGSSPRAVVTTASYEARQYGVGSAMPASQAYRLCPQAIRLSPDFEAYRSVSGRIMDILRANVELVEVAGLDEAYLDLTGMIAPRAGMARIAGQILAATGLDCSIGIAPNKLIAKLASDCEKPRGRVALTHAQALERFAASSPRLLPGVGPKTLPRLEEMGIRTVAELGAAPVEALTARFGSTLGRFLHRRGRLEDDGPVSSERQAVSRSNETTFPSDVSDRAVMEETIRELSAGLARGLRKRGLSPRTIGIKVRLYDFTTVTRARTGSAADCDADRIAATALDLLRAYGPPAPVRLLGVRASSLVPDASAEAASGATDSQRSASALAARAPAAAPAALASAAAAAPGPAPQLALPLDP
jgi:DNA polymerase-4